PIYYVEKVSTAGKKWHKTCFECGLCKTKTMLEIILLAEHEGNLCCKQCNAHRIGPKSVDFGTEKYSLGMDIGKHFGNKSRSMMINKSNFSLLPPGATNQHE
ncbi:unnamed protein product, partial [Rotaria sordida]